MMKYTGLVWVLLAACSGTSSDGSDVSDANPESDTDADSDADADADSDTDSDTDTDSDADTDTDTGPIDAVEVELTVQALPGNTGGLLVSSGVPLPPGVLFDAADLSLHDGAVELSVAAEGLGSWPDGSLRSVLLQLERDASAMPASLSLRLHQPRTTADRALVPVTWTLPEAVAFPNAQWLADSQVAGRQVPHGQVAWAADWEAHGVDEYDALKGDGDWGPDCRDDGYYSTTWSWYQLFVRTGDLEVFEWARREAVHYRDDQIVQSGNDVGTMDGRSEPRYLYQKAMAADYLLSGDPKTLEVAELMAAYALDAWDEDFFYYGATDSHFWTERRAGFALMNVERFGALTGDPVYLDAVAPRVDQLLATQAEWTDGGFIHDLYAHDPYECTTPGTYGGSAFMTGLLFEALIATHEQTGDPRLVDSVVAAADWLYDDGWTGSGFQYQIGCEADTAWASADLDLMIAHGFAFAHYHTGEPRFEDRALEIFEFGVDNGYLGTRKHYNQQYRSSAAVVWYLQ